MTRYRISDDSGVSLVELMITMAVTAIIGALMIGWVVSVSNSNNYQESSYEALDEMRTAKARLVKELRFAHAVATDPLLTNAHKVTVWIDDPDVGTVGTPDAGIGEFITWEIMSDGRLLRSTDEPASIVAEHAYGLVYDAAAAPGTSGFTYPAADLVEIALVAQIGNPGGASPQSIHTQVRLRNA